MSLILSSKRNKDGVILEIQTDYEEYLDLQGHMENIHLVSDNDCIKRTHISERGNGGATKYFLIPREMRRGFKYKNSITCNRIDKKDKILFVYVVDKFTTTTNPRELTMSKYATEAI